MWSRLSHDAFRRLRGGWLGQDSQRMPGAQSAGAAVPVRHEVGARRLQAAELTGANVKLLEA